MSKPKKGRFKMIYLFIAFAVGLCLYVSLGPKLSNMQEGIWQITMETKMPETPAGIPVKNSQCLTKGAPVPEISLPGYKCRLRRRRYPFHILGNYVFCRIQCEGSGVIQGDGYIKYSGDTLKGKIQMRTIEEEGQPQKRFNTYISGFRVGDCEQ